MNIWKWVKTIQTLWVLILIHSQIRNLNVSVGDWHRGFDTTAISQKCSQLRSDSPGHLWWTQQRCAPQQIRTAEKPVDGICGKWNKNLLFHSFLAGAWISLGWFNLLMSHITKGPMIFHHEVTPVMELILSFVLGNLQISALSGGGLLAFGAPFSVSCSFWGVQPGAFSKHFSFWPTKNVSLSGSFSNTPCLSPTYLKPSWGAEYIFISI